MPYSRSQNPFDQAGRYVSKSAMPVTLSLIGLNVVLFLLFFFLVGLRLQIAEFFVFSAPSRTPIELGTALTYPLLTMDFIQLVFGCLWLAQCGGSLERSWGSLRFALFFVIVSVASAAGLWIGAALLHDSGLLSGIWIPVAAVTVAWATLNPTLQLMIYGLIPVQARWLAAFIVGVIYFADYVRNPVLGLFALTGCVTAFLFAKYGWLSGGYRVPGGPDLRVVTQGSRRDRPLDDIGSTVSWNPAKRFKDWQQRRKLAKLLQNSGFTTKQDEKRR